MSLQITRSLVGLALAGIAFAVSAADTAPAAPKPGAAAVAAAQPAAVAAPLAPAASSGPEGDPKVAANTALLKGLRDNIDKTQANNELLKLQAEEADLKAKTGDGVNDAQVPDLVGIYGIGSSLSAEFKVGGAVLPAAPGDFVNSKWKLTKILSNGVVLTHNGETRTVLFGHRSVEGVSARFGDTSGEFVAPGAALRQPGAPAR